MSLHSNWVKHIPRFKAGDFVRFGLIHFIIERIQEFRNSNPSYIVTQLEGGYPRHLSISSKVCDEYAFKLGENVNIEVARLLYDISYTHQAEIKAAN